MSAPMPAATFVGTGRQHAAVDERVAADLERRVDARDRDAREHAHPHRARAEHDLAPRLEVGGDERERQRQVLDQQVARDLLQEPLQHAVRHQPGARQRRPEQGRPRAVEDVGDLVRRVPDRVQRGDRGADARAGDVVLLEPGPAQVVEDADVRVAAQAAGAERDPDLEPGEVAREPADRAARRRWTAAASRRCSASTSASTSGGMRTTPWSSGPGRCRRLGPRPGDERCRRPAAARRGRPARSVARGAQRAGLRGGGEHEDVVERDEQLVDRVAQRAAAERGERGHDRAASRARGSARRRAPPAPSAPPAAASSMTSSSVGRRECHETLHASAHGSSAGAPRSSSRATRPVTSRAARRFAFARRPASTALMLR